VRQTLRRKNEKIMKILKFCSIALSSGLLVGVLLGWHVGKTWTDGQQVLWEMSAPAGYGSLALLQYEQADAEHARQAVLGFTNFSKSMRKLPSAKSDQALLIDTGRAYLKLAAIEELAGNAGLSHQYVLHAQESFRSMGREIPEEKLDAEVTKIADLARPASPPL
jgi:hypothetical protein